MPEMPEMVGDAPAPAEIRAAVERIIASEVFSRSPQLGAFLRFVADAALSGTSDRIKAYTIGVEVLRRDDSFDPQIDPIVRVEATRLRRAIERYYAGPGQNDTIVIDLPRGSYVPTFQRRECAVSETAALDAVGRWSQSLRGIRMPAALSAAVAVGAIVIAATAYVGHWKENVPAGAATRGVEFRRSAALPPGNGMPVVRIEPLRVLGAASSHAVSVARLQAKIGDAFARFDTISVSITAAPGAAANNAAPAAASDYVLSGTVEYADDTATAWFTLASTAERKVVWSGTFDRVEAPGNGVTEDSVVVGLTNALLQSYGVIRARDRAIHLASGAGDPRYRCVLQAADSMRTADHEAHELARTCLEHLTSLDPSFAVGFAFLAMIYNREFQLEYPAHPGDPPPLDRALKSARQAIAVQPEDARGYLALMVVQFNRGDIAAALEAGQRSITLNKYDMLALGEYGGRLILSGNIQKGVAAMQTAGAGGRPAWHHVYLFIASYMMGDIEGAIRHAGNIPNDNVAIGQVAQVLAADAAGKPDEVRKATERLGAIGPGWVRDPQARLARIVPDRAIVERLAKGLAAAGVPGGS